MKNEEARERLWEEHLDTTCEEDNGGNRPCDACGVCMCSHACQDVDFITEYAIKLKEAGLDYSYYVEKGYIEE